jgi:hypothetical protein
MDRPQKITFAEPPMPQDSFDEWPAVLFADQNLNPSAMLLPNISPGGLGTIRKPRRRRV